MGDHLSQKTLPIKFNYEVRTESLSRCNRPYLYTVVLRLDGWTDGHYM